MFVHLCDDLMLSLIQYFLIVDLVKMFKVDLVFVLEAIVNKAMACGILF